MLILQYNGGYMRNLIIGLLGGLLLKGLWDKRHSLYNSNSNTNSNSNSNNVSQKHLLYDAPVKRGCRCETEYCTCGRHVI